jgi:hypothetical protein
MRSSISQVKCENNKRKYGEIVEFEAGGQVAQACGTQKLNEAILLRFHVIFQRF